MSEEKEETFVTTEIQKPKESIRVMSYNIKMENNRDKGKQSWENRKE